ncbi:hypothetical protein EIP91_002962 [Steccherinum ochraceum]|uniref:FAD-binding domain-containing protein n=1 Tax=Steccherinum ochraceum TaxID=92696 RepID=A0A4R0RHI2_9APHY|nr:hypothetical protein EIP91_002962 [Steccherinum ochraceum]
MDILILSGGGIGGLTLAFALATDRFDIAIDVYEAQTSFSEFGAGIALWPRVREVLFALGLKEDLNRLAPPGDTLKPVQMIRGDIPDATPWGTTPDMTAIHRAEFLKILVDRVAACSNCTAHFSKKLVSYEDSSDGPVQLAFSDGLFATCDILIGADGVKSAVRATMYSRFAEAAEAEVEATKLRNHINPVWAGQVVYRYLIPREDLEAADPTHRCLTIPMEVGLMIYENANTVLIDDIFQFQGKGMGIVTYPISGGRWINVAAIVAKHNLFGSTFSDRWSATVDRDEVAEHFNDWEKESRVLVELMKSPTRWAVNVVPNLPTYVYGRVALLGDAAHAMVPYQAVGVGQAVEDAFILATLLSQVRSNSRCIDALTVYDEMRRPFSQNIQNVSLKTGITLFMDKKGEVPLGPAFEYGELEDSAQDFGALFQWSATTSLLPDRDQALKNYHMLTQSKL